ncbi:small integral membrane protein 30-like [Tamandua tetradactyla]|uniref:small integral membrane protein 30-like n=1 Tax=Tamandua tetradactyla TaxID=48850 RepID=UPI0040544598
MTSISIQLLTLLIPLLLVLPVAEAGDAIAVLKCVVLSITGICASLGVEARKRNGRYNLQGPPKSNLVLKFFVLFRLKPSFGV